MNLENILYWCRIGNNREYLRSHTWSDIDKARGTTPRMHDYCFKHDLIDIPDLDRVWRS